MMPYHGYQAAKIEVRIAYFVRFPVSFVKIMTNSAVQDVIFAQNCVQETGFTGTAITRNSPVLTSTDVPGKVPEKCFVQVSHSNVLH